MVLIREDIVETPDGKKWIYSERDEWIDVTNPGKGKFINLPMEKRKLSIIERVKEIFHGIDWLSATVVESDCGLCPEDRFRFTDRWECFISCMDTAIRGYVWGLKE